MNVIWVFQHNLKPETIYYILNIRINGPCLQQYDIRIPATKATKESKLKNTFNVEKFKQSVDIKILFKNSQISNSSVPPTNKYKRRKKIVKK